MMKHVKTILFVLVCLILSLLLVPHTTYSSVAAHIPAFKKPPPTTPGSPIPARESIPNVVHFVFILPKSEDDFAFKFRHFLCVYSAWYYWRPDAIYLHTNAVPESIARAKDGASGKWTGLVFNMPDLKINTVSAPTHAKNGKELANMEHRSDFVRVKIIKDFGGIYIDFDVQALRDIKVLLNSGFNAVGGRQHGGAVNSGTFMSKQGGRMITMWEERMHKVYDGGWVTHSNDVITHVGERLGREPGEMLIMEQEAFAPGSWYAEDNIRLFGIHNETNALDGIKEGDPLPEFAEGFFDRMDHKDRFPEWDRDWSSTYLLHGFKPQWNNNPVEGFRYVSPRYCLERQSAYARAVYPVVREMYHQGLIAIDDAYDA
jgi:hypothetical protein